MTGNGLPLSDTFLLLSLATLNIFAPSAEDPRCARMTGNSIPLSYTVRSYIVLHHTCIGDSSLHAQNDEVKGDE
jgi:hypothetical protein